jgi:predicted ATPase/DNA-binding winged helix-turn-helix (wHTH) protein
MTTPPAYHFGPWQLLPAQRALLLQGQAVKLGGRAFDLLLVLVQRRERTVSKNELMDLVWPGLVVEENNLQVQVVALRKLLGHPAVATIPGRGYRFTLPVQSGAEEGAATAPAPPAASAPEASGARSNLPHNLPDIIGRGSELATLRQLVDEHTLVTVAGAGGIGKTRLAQAVANASRQQYSAGVWWVELAALNSSTGVAAAVAQALQVRHGDNRDATQAALAALGNEPALLVLDNAEHLLDGAAAFVQAVLSQAPRVRILVTSQEVLRLPAEHVLRLSTLALPGDDSLAAASDSGAVALFVARARAVDARFELRADNHGAIAEICRRLDGVPLAIELAAARLPLLGLQGLRERLDERFRVLTAGSRAVMRRHQTLRATLQWSHALLDAAEQTVFRRLGVFTGGFTLAAAQTVCENAGDSSRPIDRWDVLEALGGLVDKSLVLADEQDPPRYRLLETTRLFALEQLAAAGETAAALREHAGAMLHGQRSLEQTDRRRPPTPTELANWLAELPNLRCALAWLEQQDDADPAIELLGLMIRVLGWGGLSAEYLQHAQRLAPPRGAATLHWRDAMA